MAIEHVYNLQRGSVVTGRVERGIVKTGQAMEIVGMKGVYPVKVRTPEGNRVVGVVVSAARLDDDYVGLQQQSDPAVTST